MNRLHRAYAREQAAQHDEAENRAALTALFEHCLRAASADVGWADLAIRLASTVYQHLDVYLHLPDAATVHTGALPAGRETDDRTADASALTQLGFVD